MHKSGRMWGQNNMSARMEKKMVRHSRLGVYEWKTADTRRMREGRRQW